MTALARLLLVLPEPARARIASADASTAELEAWFAKSSERFAQEDRLPSFCLHHQQARIR